MSVPIRPTASQLAVLRAIRYDGHLSLSHGADASRYYFNGGGGPRVHYATGDVLVARGWIRKMPRGPNGPFWRTDFALTDAGRAARVPSSVWQAPADADRP